MCLSKNQNDNIDIDDEDDDYEMDDYSNSSIKDRINDAKDNYDSINNNVNKAKDFAQKMKANSNATQKLAEQGLKEGAKAGAQTAGTTATSAAGTAATGTAAGGGAAAGGAAVGWPVIVVIIIVILIILIILGMSEVFIATEDTYDNLYDIIRHREEENGKLLIEMWGDGKVEFRDGPLGFLGDWEATIGNDEIAQIMIKDGNEYTSEVTGEIVKDYSVLKYLKEESNNEYGEFYPTDTNNPTEGYKEKSDIIRRYLLAGRDNFNLINWKVIDQGEPEKVIENNLKDFLDRNFQKPFSFNISNINSDDIVYFPEAEEYPLSPSDTDGANSLDTYLDLTYKHLQHWIIPFSIGTTSADNDFGLDVLQYAKSYIEVELFEVKMYTQQIVEEFYFEPEEHDIEENPVIEEFSVREMEDQKYYIPKLSHYEDLYKIGKFNYALEPADTTDITKATTSYTTTVPIIEKQYINRKWVEVMIGEKKITDYYWQDKVVGETKEEGQYKLSYLNDDKNAKDYGYDEDGNFKNGDPITRIDWYMDSGKGGYEQYPNKSDNYVVDWFDRLYTNQMSFNDFKNDGVINEYDYDNYSDYSKIRPDGPWTTIKFADGDTRYVNEFKNYLAAKYQNADPSLKEVNGIKMGIKDRSPGIIIPYSFTELYLAYDQIDQYYADIEENASDYFSGSHLDLSNLPLTAFAWPMNPSNTRVNSPYGPRNLTGSFHYGIDIGGVPEGSPVYAAHDGVVVYVNNTNIKSYKVNGKWVFRGGFGTNVRIQTPDGAYTTIYGHLVCNSPTVKVGDTVTKGQQIAQMGNTGSSTGPHLHFEIWAPDSNNRIDPAIFFNIAGNKYAGSTPGLLDHVSSDTPSGSLDLLKQFEGSGPTRGDSYIVYDDGTGTLTVGYGVTWGGCSQYLSQLGVRKDQFVLGATIPKDIVDRAKSMFIANKTGNIEQKFSNIGVTLSESQKAAVIMYTYNVGNCNDIVAAAKYIKDNNITDKAEQNKIYWNEAFKGPITGRGYGVMKGLARRRNAEYILFTTGVATGGYEGPYDLNKIHDKMDKDTAYSIGRM